MKDISFFDANCCIGCPMNPGLEYVGDAESLLKEMDRAGVEKAIVRHINAGLSGAVYTNAALAEMLGKEAGKRLFGCWSILSEQCNELPPEKIFFKEMKKNNIRTLTLFPAEHRWVPSRLTIGRLMDAIAERRIPVILGTSSFRYGWDSVYDFIEKFPKNIYIYSGAGLWGADRNIRPLLENYAGFHFEISDYWLPEGIADLAKLYGAEKILYGSGMPRYNHASMMLAIKNAELSLKEKKAVAGGNLQRLVDEVEL